MPDNDWANLLSQNLIAILIVVAGLVLVLTVFFATGRRKPRQPLGPRGGRSITGGFESARDVESALARTGSIVRRRGRADHEEGATSLGNPLVTAIAVLAVIAVIAAVVILLAVAR